MRKDMDSTGERRVKQHRQCEGQPEAQDRSVTPNPELSQDMLTTATYGVTGILIPTIHLGE